MGKGRRIVSRSFCLNGLQEGCLGTTLPRQTEDSLDVKTATPS